MSSAGRRLRVLVAGGDPADLARTAALLGGLGFEADAAADGRQAAAAVLRRPYGLVVMDAAMPVLDGLSAAREIRRLEADRTRTPIAAAAAGFSAEDRRRAREAGADDFVAKPARVEDLRAVLERWTAPLDRAQAGGVRSALGPEAWAELLQTYRRALSEGLLELGAAGARSDAEAARGRAHALKGASANMGAVVLQRLFGWVERRAAQGACPLVEALPVLEDEAGRALAALAAVLGPFPE